MYKKIFASHRFSSLPLHFNMYRSTVSHRTAVNALLETQGLNVHCTPSIISHTPPPSSFVLDDALAIGNHELYLNEVAEDTYKVPLCGIGSSARVCVVRAHNYANHCLFCY